MSASCKFYTCGRIMEKLQVDSVTSEGDTTANPIENAFDFNLDTDWYPSSTANQVIALDLNNTISEVIGVSDDRTFASDTGRWQEVDMDSWVITLGWLLVSSTANGQYGGYSNGGAKIFERGHTYIVTYTYVENVAGFRFMASGDGQVIGTCVVGTAQELTFTATDDSTTMQLRAVGSTADGEFDNMSIRDITNEASAEVDGFGLFVRNYDTDFGSSAGMLVEWSDDGSNWTTFADKLIESEMTNAIGDPLRLYIESTSKFRRYWRMTLHNMEVAIEVGQFFLLRSRSVTVGNAWPERDRSTFQNKLTASAGRTPVSLQRARRSLRNISRIWRYADQDVLDEIVGAVSDSFGSVRPFIFNEGSDYRVMRFMQDEVDENETDYLLFHPKVDMQELPHIEDGQVF